MDDARVVRFLEGLGDLLGDLQRLVDGNRPFVEALLEVLTLDELENEKRLAVCLLETVDRGDLRVVERREKMSLALEALKASSVFRNLSRQDLDRHVPPELRVGGAVDLPHPPGPEELEDLVRAEALPRRQSHVWPPS